MKLCLLVSRRCNLRCDFCAVRFTGEDMAYSVARLGIDRFLSTLRAPDRPIVKFFGGEPLLNWKVVRGIVELSRTRWAKRGLRFELATNGSHMDVEKAAYLRDRPEVEVIFSFPSLYGPQIPGSWFTLVLERSCDPMQILSRFESLWRAGWRRFNVLPTYYLVWSEPQLVNLQMTLTALSRYIRGLWRKGENLRVRNLELWSPIPLCNDAQTIDVDGSIYASNLMQLEGLDHARELLRLGHVGDQGALRPSRSSPELLQNLMRRWAGPEAWQSTQRVDSCLDAFVESLQHSQSQSALISLNS